MTDREGLSNDSDLQKSKVVKGIGWNLIAIVGEQISTLVAFVLIARILGPSEFGIVVLSVALIDILITFVRAGVSEALVRSPDVDSLILASAFWLNVTLAVIIALTIYAGAPSFGTLVGVPETVPLLQAMTFVFPLVAAGSVAEALLSRRMAYAAIARRQVLGSLLGAVTAVVLALTGFGVWAMIGQRLVILSVSAILSIWAARLVPQFSFSASAAKRIIYFGGGITSINVMYKLQPRAAELAIGFLAQPASVALYRAAYRMIDLVNQLPLQPVMRVTFPTLCRLVDAPDRFKGTLKRFMEGLQLLLLPAYGAVGYFSASIFGILFGHKWDGAVSAFVLLLVASAIRISFVLLGPAASARGAVRSSATFAFIDVGVGLLLMVAAAPWGIEAIAASRIAAGLMLWPISYFMLMKPAGLSLMDIIDTLSKPLSITCLLLFLLCALDQSFAYFNTALHPIVSMLICPVIYALLLVPIARKSLLDLANILGAKRLIGFVRIPRIAK